jgi:hypothetical protein
MQKIRSALALASFVISLTSTARAQFADSVVAYASGSGVGLGYNNPAHALGAPTTFIGYQNSDPFNAPYDASHLVSVGAGGSLTVQFSNPIQNSGANPFGLDFTIFGNAGFVDNDWPNGLADGSLYGANEGVTHVSVSADGVNFYLLNPVLAPTVDGLFPADSSGNFLLPVNPALTGADFVGQNLAGIRALYNGSAGGTSYDISWAQGATLSSVSFVRIEVLSGKSEIDALVTVPEPGVISLAWLGAAALGFARRKK